MRLRDPVTNDILHFVPGGAVEPGETPAQAAARETYEEAGIRVDIDEASEHTLRYPFVWGGAQYDVTTHFFRGAPAESCGALPRVAPVAPVALYQLGALWVPVEHAEVLLSFDQNIWSVMREFLSST